jgi:excisionase family DNA binding protein
MGSKALDSTVTGRREDLPLVLSVKQLQHVLGLGKNGVYNLLHQPGCPVIRLGRAVRVSRDRFFEWLDRQAGELSA